MPTTWVQWNNSSAVRSAARGQAGRNRGLVADQQDAQVGVGLHRLHGAGDDGSRRVVPAHGVQREQHRLLLLLALGGYQFAGLRVGPAAAGADAMALNRVAAAVAVIELCGCRK